MAGVGAGAAAAGDAGGDAAGVGVVDARAVGAAIASAQGAGGLTLLWAGPAAAGDYDPGGLAPADAARAGRARTPRAELEWRVSRAALRQAGVGTLGDAPRAWSLSHSNGHALVAHGPAGWQVGVDLERRRVRDVEALAEWCCDEAEQAHLLTLLESERLTFFYQLWTLKEAFIKAAGLDFPADTRKVGLRQEPDGWSLRTPAGVWAARSWTVGDDWIASVVWSVPDSGLAAAAQGTAAAEPSWHAARNNDLPPLHTLYKARGQA
ncbi:hypothetical protein ASB57_10775 [Bordetella sp. N]|nr:hypothetical protein ASB57_10775 [Bordetella sp. N]